ncbi:sulfurtransferase TusA family protein [Roseovarius sp. S1116L3]|uniref:sulfurtransferase TusA family protein n=1 Tax=Roseovarius roseus TaxID=3342636 RepID=UPI0037266C23
MEEIDAIGLLCPLPVLKLRKRLSGIDAGDEICLLCDDPAAAVDVPHFCAEAGHGLVSVEERGTSIAYVVRKGQGAGR